MHWRLMHTIDLEILRDEINDELDKRELMTKDPRIAQATGNAYGEEPS